MWMRFSTSGTKAIGTMQLSIQDTYCLGLGSKILGYMEKRKNINLCRRRAVLKGFASVAAMAALSSVGLTAIPRDKRRYQIGACDWSIGKQCETGALALAKTLGMDGVQISLGTAQNDMHLRKKVVQKAYQQAASTYGTEISSLAIGELNGVPYKSAPEAEKWVDYSIDAAKEMGCRVVLLAFFGHGDLKGDKAGIAEVVNRLKKIAPKAEKKGIILGIESMLSADELLTIIEEIGSTHVQVYYDVANATEMGYDIYREMRQLGRKCICEVHVKENGYLLGQGEIDFVKVRNTLDEIGYDGWVIMEGGVPSGMSITEAYLANTKYIRSIFS